MVLSDSALSRVFVGLLSLALAACTGGGGGGTVTVDPPSNLIANAASPTQVQLSWTAPAGTVTGYALERRQGDGSFAAVGGSISASSFNFTDTVPQGGRSYAYRLKALNGSASSSVVESNKVSVPVDCAPGSSDSRSARGCFGPVVSNWPLVPTFTGLLPNGRVIAWYASDDVGLYRERTDVHNQNPRTTPGLGTQDKSDVTLWNPAEGGQTSAFQMVNLNQTAGKGTDLFCAGYIVLNDGKFLTAGGNIGATFGSIRLNVFDPANSTWENGPGPRTPNMWRDRWYPPLTKLPNGRVLISGGTSKPDPNFVEGSSATETSAGDSTRQGQPICRTGGGNVCPQGLQGNASASGAAARGIRGGYNNALEVYDPSTGNLSMLGVTARDIASFEHYYPWFHVAPNGMVYLSGASQEKAFLDLAGTGQWRNIQGATGQSQRPYGSSVMYEPGKILVTGGGNAFMQNSAVVQGQSATANNTLLITLSGSSATIAAGPNMNSRRTHHNSTLLPNGQVFVHGGQQNGGEFAYSASLPWERTVNPETIWNIDLGVKTSEIWTPGGSFQPAARSEKVRMYHSVSLLLPDATVLTAGGGGCGTCDNQDPSRYGSLSGQPSSVRMERINQKNSEVFYPPYLFKADGSLQERPVIVGTSVQDNGGFPTVGYNTFFTVDFAHLEAGRSIGKVSLLALGTPTHAFDQNQRYLEPDFTANGNTLTVSTDFRTKPKFGGATASQNAAPPGFYMLFILDDQGVPSEAKIIRIQ